MNTRRTPKCVRTAHLANERAQLSRDLRTANTVAGSPAPIRPKPSTVPANDGLRPDNRNHLKDGRKPAIEQTNRKRSVLLRYGRFGVRRRSTLTCCRTTRFSASSVALALKREARIPKISLNRSVIRMQAYAVRLLRLRRIEFSVHTGGGHLIGVRYHGEVV
jgi:hypothetical protein